MSEKNTASQAEIQDVLKNFIIETFLPDDDPARLTPDYPLVSTGIVDSASLVILLTYLEDEYGVTFTVEQIAHEEVESIETISAAVHRKLQEK